MSIILIVSPHLLDSGPRSMLRAEYCPDYFRRFLWVSLACLAFSGWCCYDALVAYPAKYKVAVVYDQLEAAAKEGKILERKVPEIWAEKATEMGWSTEIPLQTADEVQSGIGKQYFMMILCALVGAPAFIKWRLGQGQWVEGDAELIRNSSGQEVKIADITKINKKKWDAKGIAVIHHKPAKGGNAKFVMDDFKFEREKMGELMLLAEADLKPEQFVGGLSERAKTELAEQKAAEAKAAKAAAKLAEAEAEAEAEVDAAK